MTTPTAADERYLFGAFRLDVPARELRRDAEIVPLTAKAFDTLVVLVRYRDRVVDKETLMKQVWPDAFVGDDSLTQNISVLRRALGDDPAQPQFIVTVAALRLSLRCAGRDSGRPRSLERCRDRDSRTHDSAITGAH
jgi:DNA-binding winged helix-turn-helix (wHTH) protein